MNLPLVPLDMDARPPANEFNAHIIRYTSGVFIFSFTMGLADGSLHSICEVRNAPATRTFVHTADGRTYTVVLDVNADGSATANFDVVENEVKIVSTTRTFLPTAPRPTPADGIYQRLGVGSNVKAPTLVDRVEPILPPDERAASITGVVIVETKINDRGTVDDVKVLKALPFGMDQAAADAVRRWTFHPATRGDQPVPVVVNLMVNFRSSDEVKPVK